MKTMPLLAVVLFLAAAGQAQPTFQQRLQPLPPPGPNLPPRLPGALPSDAAPAKEHVNYLIRIEWKEPKGETKSLEVLTTEGHFNLDTIQKTSVKINGSEIPTTLRFEGSLTAINDEKGQLQLFLGRTVPYVTGTVPTGTSTYSQLSVGLNSTFVVKFGKPQVIQTDENGEISVLVKRVEI